MAANNEKQVDSCVQLEDMATSATTEKDGAIILEFSVENALLEKKIRRKFDLRILPIVTGIFLLAFIDRYAT